MLISLEFFILCIATPSVIIITKAAPFMFVFLWGAALYSYLLLRYHYKLSLSDIWRADQVTWEHLKPILTRFVACTIAMFALSYWLNPSEFMRLPLQQPYLALILCFVYPIISALPQELVFCNFIFRRYERFFGRGINMVIASTIIFAYAHILYINWIAPTLSLLAGYIFASTYQKHKSLALVTIEHGLYGNALFLSGLGWYFYSGSVQY